MVRTRLHLAHVVVAAFAALLLIVLGAAPAPAAELPPTRSAPTAQLNGVAFAQVVVGGTVFVGGRFSTARPAGARARSKTMPRSNLLAYDASTGKLLAWAPRTNGIVRALAASADGRTIYAAGSFTTVNGRARQRLVAIAASTGGVRAAFHPRLNAPAFAVAVHGGAVYVGGAFSSANGATRTRAAAFSTATGALRPWGPRVDGDVLALVVSSTGRSVVIGGRFARVNGRSESGSQRVGTGSGQTNLTWRVNAIVGNHGPDAAVYSLSSSGGYVYGTGYSYGSTVQHRLEGAFVASWSSGGLHWIEDCHGDSYSAARTGSTVYVVGHPHYCGNIGGFGETKPATYHRALAFTQAVHGSVKKNPIPPYSNFAGNPAPRLLDWMPAFDTGRATGQDQGPWNVVTARGWILVAGEFTTVDGIRQQGLARFPA